MAGLATLTCVALVVVTAVVVVSAVSRRANLAPGAGPGQVLRPASASGGRTGALAPRGQAAAPSTAPPRLPAKPPAARTLRTGLANNDIYRINLRAGGGRCSLAVRRPQPPLKNAQLAPYLRTVVACLTSVFDAPLRSQGFLPTKPAVRTYRGTLATSCGDLGSQLAPAYYCPVNRTLYWPVASDDGAEAYTYARLGYVALAAHEYGHHLQTMTGIMTEFSTRYWSAGRKQRLALSRRMELQATCFEGVFLAYTEDSLRFTGQDRYELHTWHGYTGDEDPPTDRKPDHGTSKAQIYWLERGLDSADFGRCNTWAASAGRVR